MISLRFPSVTLDDDAYLATICSQNNWAAPHHSQWQVAYNQYRAHFGNPWNVSLVRFPPAVEDEQCHLYDKRRSGKRIREIRDMPNLLCCPMCGSGTTGSIDHFLPRDIFPEFSVMLANLVPACTHCNSSAKGNTYRGVNPESFLHPYFESLAQSPIWLIETVRPLAAATFKPTVLSTLTGTDALRIAFHLRNILGKQFHLWAANRWSTLPQVIRNSVARAGVISADEVQDHLGKQLAQAITTTGINSWLSAFLRGIRNDAGVHAFVASAANQLAAVSPA